MTNAEFDIRYMALHAAETIKLIDKSGRLARESQNACALAGMNARVAAQSAFDLHPELREV